MGEASHPGPTTKRRRMLRTSRRVWDSDEQSSSMLRGPTQVDSDSEDELPDLLAALEQDLCEANENSQSQQVMVEPANPIPSRHVMGVAHRAVNSGRIAETVQSSVEASQTFEVCGHRCNENEIAGIQSQVTVPASSAVLQMAGRRVVSNRFFSLATDSEDEQIDRRILILVQQRNSGRRLRLSWSRTVSCQLHRQFAGCVRRS